MRTTAGGRVMKGILVGRCLKHIVSKQCHLTSLITISHEYFVQHFSFISSYQSSSSKHFHLDFLSATYFEVIDHCNNVCYARPLLFFPVRQIRPSVSALQTRSLRCTHLTVAFSAFNNIPFSICILQWMCIDNSPTIDQVVDQVSRGPPLINSNIVTGGESTAGRLPSRSFLLG